MRTNSAQHNQLTKSVYEGLARISTPPRAPSDIEEDLSLQSNLNIDSLGFIELIINIENTYGIRFNDEHTEITSFTTVASLVAYITKALDTANRTISIE